MSDFACNMLKHLTPADTQAPLAPGNFTAMAASSTQINLSWSASTDYVGGDGVQRVQGTGMRDVYK